MDSLQENFEGFNPQVDQDTTIKSALSIIFKCERLRELSCLLTDRHEIDGIKGIPGWVIECRDTRLSGNMPGYFYWPKNSYFMFM